MKIAVDLPALEAEFQRSQATAEAEKASRIARSEAKLAGAAAERSGRTPPTARDIPGGGSTAAAVEFLKSAMHEISAADAAQGSVEERLAKLQRLRDGGVLSPEEYEAQRQRILQSL
jgi:Short C-terminal domain